VQRRISLFVIYRNETIFALTISTYSYSVQTFLTISLVGKKRGVKFCWWKIPTQYLYSYTLWKAYNWVYCNKVFRPLQLLCAIVYLDGSLI